MLPFELVVEGPPVSQQTKNKKRLQGWKQAIQKQAAAKWPPGGSALLVNVRIQIVYYYEGDALDTDNMIKPIQDALSGLVYQDDNQVTDVTAGKRALDGSFRVKGMSSVLAEGFCTGNEFLHIRVEEAPDPEILL